MKRFPRILLFIVAVAVLSWFLPWLYALCFPGPSGEPFCSFSPVSGKWVVTKSQPGAPAVITEVERADSLGNIVEGSVLTREQRDSLVPQLFYKELLAHDRLPDTIAGMEVNAHTLRTHELMLQASPRDYLKRTAGVWMMMESMPERVELSDPKEVFRFTPDGGMEFVDMATNSVVPGRSRRFTEHLRSRHFAFPATDLSANITSRKPYDEGYLMIDSDGKLFHVKQRAGRPYAEPILLPSGKKALKAYITEEADRSVLGFVVDTDGGFYLIDRTEGYRPINVPLDFKVDPSKHTILCMGSLFGFTFRFSDPDGVSKWRAVRRSPVGYGLDLLGSYDFVRPRTAASKVADYIFPYVLSFTSTNDSLAYPRITRLSAYALWLNAVMALIVFFLPVGDPKASKPWCVSILTLICGIYAFIPALILRK